VRAAWGSDTKLKTFAWVASSRNEIDEDQGRPFIAMQLLNGMTFARTHRQPSPLTFDPCFLGQLRSKIHL
jgi:hypothetical protein